VANSTSREEGGRGWEVREILTLKALFLTKIDTVSFFPVMLAGSSLVY